MVKPLIIGKTYVVGTHNGDIGIASMRHMLLKKGNYIEIHT